MDDRAADAVPHPQLAGIRLCAQLNALTWPAAPGDRVTSGPVVRPSAEVAAAWICAEDAAHHVIDRCGLLGLDRLHASELSEALTAATALEGEGWLLVLPRPGHLGGLSGPAGLSSAALAAEVAVIAAGTGLALVPEVIGSGVQWQVLEARPPRPGPTPYEAERALAEAVLEATSVLSALQVAGGDRPPTRAVALPASFPARRQVALDRALALYEACRAALDGEGSAISSWEMQTRREHLTRLLGPATELICAVCSSPPTG